MNLLQAHAFPTATRKTQQPAVRATQRNHHFKKGNSIFLPPPPKKEKKRILFNLECVRRASVRFYTFLFNTL